MRLGEKGGVHRAEDFRALGLCQEERFKGIGVVGGALIRYVFANFLLIFLRIYADFWSTGHPDVLDSGGANGVFGEGGNSGGDIAEEGGTGGWPGCEGVGSG